MQSYAASHSPTINSRSSQADGEAARLGEIPASLRPGILLPSTPAMLPQQIEFASSDPHFDVSTIRAKAPAREQPGGQYDASSTRNDRPATRVPLVKRSMIMMHSSSLWRILSAAKSDIPPAQTSPALATSQAYGASHLFSTSAVKKAPLKKKRISVDMIGPPAQFSHLGHAGDVHQARTLFGSSSPDEGLETADLSADLLPPIPLFHRDNAGFESISKGTLAGTVRIRDDTTNNDPVAAPPRLSIDDLRVEHQDPVFPPPKAFVPSLATIEKAVATRIFFETHYYAILKQPRAREQRRQALEKELTRLNISDAERQNVRAAFALSETAHLRDIRKRLDANSFVKLKTIGHGAFGVVSLVKEANTGELFAIKQIRKAEMLRRGQEGHIRAERDLLVSASTSTRRIVPLHASFQDSENLYLVLSYMPGGDLLTLLIERDTFTEDFARFYIAEMLLAIQETHTVLGAIHRDIKPDNFLFDAQGHILLSDFGLATDHHWAHHSSYYDMQRKGLLQKHGLDLDDGSHAPRTRPFDQELLSFNESEPQGSLLTWRDQNRRRLAYSLVGTNNYMACEVLRGAGYDSAADFWSLGVILFECLFGYPPFVSKSRQQTRQKILNWRQALRFPSKPRVSREAQDLILNLITEREDRLGSSTRASREAVLQGREFDDRTFDGAEMIKAHPWFRGISFDTLHTQTPPFVPQLREPTDTRYFDDDIDDAPLPPADGAKNEQARDPLLRDAEHGQHLLDIRKQLAFSGWTFKKPRRSVYEHRTGLQYISGAGKDKMATLSTSTIKTAPTAGSAFARSMSI